MTRALTTGTTGLIASVAVAVTLGACSTPATPGDASPTGLGATAGTAATAPMVTGGGAMAGSTLDSTPTDTASSTAATGTGVTAAPDTLPTAFTDINKTISDPDLGHQITINKMARNLPWPAGYTASADTYELVGLELKLVPGTTYTAQLRLQDLSINTGQPNPSLPTDVLNPVLQQAGWALLPATVDQSKSATGWVVFRVDPKDASALRLDFTRPTSKVAGSGKVFNSQVFSAQLVG